MIAVGDPTVVTADAVLGACCATLADYKLPRYLVVRAEPLPRNMSGKVLKRELQRTYSESADLGDPLR